ncbi:MAG: Holliday junction branch migration protein RuvA [Candidatus Izemoplasma sp.]|nr:Holliday junction branch migration protein RuvA [Candidatus Izemoplasma sp.]
MYAYLNGTVTDILPNSVVIDVGGVGYDVLTPNPYEYNKNETTTIYVYQHVREDAILLYGFKDKDAKALFIKLLGVKGIGPKSAVAILASGNTNDVVHAIEVGNAKFLTKFPGIGPKASQQIILDLKGKLALDETSISSESITEVEAALKSLGYRAREIQKAIKDLDGSKPTDTLIKEALGKMLKK